MRRYEIELLGSLALMAAVAANPFGHQLLHPHLHHHMKREETVIVTVTEELMVTVDIWVEPTSLPHPGDFHAQNKIVHISRHTQTSIRLPVIHLASSTQSALAVQATPDHQVSAQDAHTGQSKAAVLPPAPAPPATTPAPVAPVPVPAAVHASAPAQADPNAAANQHQAEMLAYQQSQTDKQNAVNEAQEQKNKEQEAANQQHAQQVNQPAPQAQAQQQQQQSARVPKPATGVAHATSGSAATGGSCGAVGGKCMASDVTMYNDQGTGACGWANDTNTEDYFALAIGTFGTYTNDAPGPHKNSYCGRAVTIQAPGGHLVSAMLTDACPGCTGYSIDLSLSLWNKVFPGQAATRNHDVSWWFTGEAIYHGAGG